MRSSRRCWFLVLVLTLAMAMLLAACGSDSVTEDKIAQMKTAILQYPSYNDEWRYNVYDCYVEIEGYRGPQVNSLTFPSEIEGLPVWVINGYKIGKNWDTKLESVTIPDSVLIIGDETFRDSDITTVNFSEGLVSIGELAFYCCPLNNIVLPNTLKEIGASAFRETDLTEIEIPENVVTIGEAAFYNCPKLKMVVIPESVKEIGDEAFVGPQNYLPEDDHIYIYSDDVVINGNIGLGWTIHGYAGSTVAAYCAENYRVFELIK